MPAREAARDSALPPRSARGRRAAAAQMDDEHLLRVKLSVAAASAAAAKAQALLAGCTRSKRVAPPTLEQCDECLREAAAVPVLLPVADELRVVASQGAEWTARAAEALQVSVRTAAGHRARHLRRQAANPCHSIRPKTRP